MKTPPYISTDAGIPRRLLATRKRIGLVCAMMPRRIGARAFVTYLEWRHFRPGTDMNQCFNYVIVNWLEMRYALVIIPREFVPQADALAKELGLRRADGIPMVLSAEKGAMQTQKFPFDSDNVFTMENVPGHFVYQNDPQTNRTAYQVEDDFVDAYVKAEVEKNHSKGTHVD